MASQLLTRISLDRTARFGVLLMYTKEVVCMSSKTLFVALALAIAAVCPSAAQEIPLRTMTEAEIAASPGAQAAISVLREQSHLGFCTTAGQVLCLRDGRFSVAMAWATATEEGFGFPVQLTSDSGYFWFFNPANIEVVIKVLNGCGLNSRYWVFAAGLTNVNVEIAVLDRLTDIVVVYENPLNRPFPPLQDTNALPTCP
jgi:hypothetical protein